ncbi:MAG: NTP transferase domain-containing protein [Actinomycetes bacterium]
MTVAGLLLAAGEGRRFGMPKALVRGEDDEPWVSVRAGTLAGGGCQPVLVVLGAVADDARPLLPAEAVPVVAQDWAEGMGASLRAGLRAAGDLQPTPDAVLVALVDTPGLTGAAVARIVALGRATTLAQASYDGKPGHPVLLGRDHWDGVLQAARGDRGARDYLRSHAVQLIECGDVADGRDVDERDGVGHLPWHRA